MIGYDEQLRKFVYKGKGFTLYCYSMPELQKQAQTIYGINKLTFLN